MKENDLEYLRKAIKLARRARENANHPFGAVLVNKQGQIILEAENSVVADQDITAHAEHKLVRQASRVYDSEYLANCSLYASTEPCPMCAGAIFWGNIRRVVFGLSQVSLHEIIGKENEEVLYLPCREIFAKGNKVIEVIGPILEDEAREVHIDFWN